MALLAHASGSGGFVLRAYGRAIGWIEGRGVGFTGFGSAGDALAAALTSHAVLCRWMERERLDDYGGAPLDAEVTVRPDGGYEWLLLNGRPAGRLIPPGLAPLRTDDPAFSFELFLPRRAGTDAALALAQAIYRAVMEPGAPVS